MTRRLLNLVTVLLLLLCVAACVLWVRSARVRDVLSSTNVPSARVWQSYRLETLRGGFQFEFYRLENDGSGFSADNVRPLRWMRDTKTTTTPVWTPETSDRTFGIHFFPFDWPSLKEPSLLDAPDFELKVDRVEDVYYANTWQGVVVPYWGLCIASAMLPIARTSLAIYAVARRRTGDHLGLCPICGYDLTGNVSGVCPECGRAR